MSVREGRRMAGCGQPQVASKRGAVGLGSATKKVGETQMIQMKASKWISASLAIAFAAVSAAPASAQSRPVITVAQAGDGFQFLTQQIAIKGGFFEKEGYDVQIADVGSGPRVVAALMGGSAIYSPLGLINLLNARERGGTLVAVASESDLIDIQMVLSNDAIKKLGITDTMSTDQKIARLKDVRISITSPGSSTDTMLRTLLKARGVETDEVIKVLPTGGGSNMLAALEKGANDGFVWGAPQTLLAEKKGLGKIIIDPFKGHVPEVKDVPYIVITTSMDTVKNKPKELRASVRALTHAMKFARDNPAEAKRIVRSAFAEMDDEIFNLAWNNYVKAIPATPIISKAQFDNTKKWLDIIAKQPLTVRYEDSIVNSFAEEAAADILKK
jgi:NitT/TauT family transport system substrate-binding protein